MEEKSKVTLPQLYMIKGELITKMEIIETQLRAVNQQINKEMNSVAKQPKEEVKKEDVNA